MTMAQGVAASGSGLSQVSGEPRQAEEQLSGEVPVSHFNKMPLSCSLQGAGPCPYLGLQLTPL